MRPLPRPAQDGLVRNEPIVAPATEVLPFGMAPSRDVGLVGIRHANATPIHRRIAVLGQVKNELVAIVDEALRLNRLEVAGGNLLALLCLHSDGFDPVESILKNELVFQ